MARSALVSFLAFSLFFLGGQALARGTASPHSAMSVISQGTADIVELAARYENAEGMPRDYSRALALYCQAADRGDPGAFLSIGWMYMNGRGVPVTDPIAVRWFRKAADRGIAQAANLLQMLSGVEPSLQTGCPLTIRQTRTHRAVAPEIKEIILQEAAAADVDPVLIWSIIEVESGFDPRAVSIRNAQGLMQLMPETAARFHLANTFDPRQNIHVGTVYLRFLLDRFAGDLKAAIAAYNAGENAVTLHHGVPNYPETTKYVTDVIKLYQSSTGSPVQQASRRRKVPSEFTAFPN
jgi:hypothetical protein